MKRNNFLDVMKGLCILFVVVTHYNWSNQERLNYLFPFWIAMAVPMFMIISGYLYAKSYQKSHIVHISEAYSIHFIWKKIVRYTSPFLMAYIVEIVCLVLSEQRISIEKLIKMLLTGGEGKGSYYYPIMLQFIFVFPIIYFIIKKYKEKGLILCGVMNLAYEILQWAYSVDGDTYRLLLFRYLLVIAVGCYIAMEDVIIEWKKSLICMPIGIIYIVLVCYMKNEPIFIEHWRKTSCVACLYIIPIAMYLIKNCTIRCKALEFLGKASFNIFFVQMVYYEFLSKKVYAVTEHRAAELLINVTVIVVVGVVFYLVENYFTNKLIKNISFCMEKKSHLAR